MPWEGVPFTGGRAPAAGLATGERVRAVSRSARTRSVSVGAARLATGDAEVAAASTSGGKVWVAWTFGKVGGGGFDRRFPGGLDALAPSAGAPQGPRTSSIVSL